MSWPRCQSSWPLPRHRHPEPSCTSSSPLALTRASAMLRRALATLSRKLRGFLAARVHNGLRLLFLLFVQFELVGNLVEPGLALGARHSAAAAHTAHATHIAAATATTAALGQRERRSQSQRKQEPYEHKVSLVGRHTFSRPRENPVPQRFPKLKHESRRGGRLKFRIGRWEITFCPVAGTPANSRSPRRLSTDNLANCKSDVPRDSLETGGAYVVEGAGSCTGDFPGGRFRGGIGGAAGTVLVAP